jgi:hypothetical protein
MPRALPILIPDLLRYAGGAGSPAPEDLLFFDLETTGLSGGAGTVAFLAALGRFVLPGGLRVDQYLLLDYPGEADFLAALLPELTASGGPGGKAPLIVTYNGKTFDLPLLKTRCLMNGISPPELPQADLLHPARRLWKRLLPGCSQGEIETTVLGLDRTGDTPGALAPEIWFSFLRTGASGELLGICDHNLRDISGLAHLFAAFAWIAGGPVQARVVYPYDIENLALHWRKASGRNPAFFDGELFAAGGELLALAAGEGRPRAIFALARDLFRGQKPVLAREYLGSIIAGEYPPRTKAVAGRMLAIDAEWRLRDPRAALAYTETALAREGIPEQLKNELLRRRERLLNYPMGQAPHR